MKPWPSFWGLEVAVRQKLLNKSKLGQKKFIGKLRLDSTLPGADVLGGDPIKLFEINFLNLFKSLAVCGQN